MNYIDEIEAISFMTDQLPNTFSRRLAALRENVKKRLNKRTCV